MKSEELEKLKSGETLESDKDYIGLSNSKGFCFFPEIVRTDSWTIDGEDMSSYLENEYDYVVLLDIDSDCLKRGKGNYEINGRITPVVEYSTTAYSNEVARILEIKKV
jgi:hypothetical protein